MMALLIKIRNKSEFWQSRSRGDDLLLYDLKNTQTIMTRFPKNHKECKNSTFTKLWNNLKTLQTHRNVHLSKIWLCSAHTFTCDFTFSNLHMDVITPPMSGPYFCPGQPGRRRPICPPDSVYLPRRPPGDQAVTGECLAGRPQVWRACTDAIWTSSRKGRASWALLRGIQDGDQKTDLKQE